MRYISKTLFIVDLKLISKKKCIRNFKDVNMLKLYHLVIHKPLNYISLINNLR